MPADHETNLTHYLLEKVADISGFEDPTVLDTESSLLELGFDSLMAVQLRNVVRKDMDIDLPIGELFQETSIAELAIMLNGQITPSETGGAGPQIQEIE